MDFQTKSLGAPAVLGSSLLCCWLKPTKKVDKNWHKPSMNANDEPHLQHAHTHTAVCCRHTPPQIWCHDCVNTQTQGDHGWSVAPGSECVCVCVNPDCVESGPRLPYQSHASQSDRRLHPSRRFSPPLPFHAHLSEPPLPPLLFTPQFSAAVSLFSKKKTTVKWIKK